MYSLSVAKQRSCSIKSKSDNNKTWQFLPLHSPSLKLFPSKQAPEGTLEITDKSVDNVITHFFKVTQDTSSEKHLGVSNSVTILLIRDVHIQVKAYFTINTTYHHYFVNSRAADDFTYFLVVLSVGLINNVNIFDPKKKIYDAFAKIRLTL